MHDGFGALAAVQRKREDVSALPRHFRRYEEAPITGEPHRHLHVFAVQQTFRRAAAIRRLPEHVEDTAYPCTTERQSSSVSTPRNGGIVRLVDGELLDVSPLQIPDPDVTVGAGGAQTVSATRVPSGDNSGYT